MTECLVSLMCMLYGAYLRLFAHKYDTRLLAVRTFGLEISEVESECKAIL
jgi:hypothetical protein